jgi:hypothetical protein
MIPMRFQLFMVGSGSNPTTVWREEAMRPLVNRRHGAYRCATACRDRQLP